MKTDKLLHLIQQKRFMRSGGALPLPKHQAQISQVGHKDPNNIKQQVFKQYPILNQVAPIDSFHVAYAQGKDLNALRATGHNPEYINEEPSQMPIGPDKYGKERFVNNPRPNRPGQYTTLIDSAGKTQQQLVDLAANDFVSHSLHKIPQYNNLTNNLNTALTQKYGKGMVQGNGGVDAYVRGMIDNSSEYQPYKDELQKIDTAYTNPINRFINQKQHGGSLPKAQKGKPIYVTDPNDPRLKAYNDSSSLYNQGIEREKFMRIHGMTNAVTHEFPFSRVTSYGYATKPKGKIQPVSAVSQETDPSHPMYYQAEWLKYKEPVRKVELKKEDIQKVERPAFDFSLNEDEDIQPIAPTPYVPDPVRRVMNPAFNFNVDFMPNRTKKAVVDEWGNPRYKYYNGDKLIGEHEYNNLMEKADGGSLPKAQIGIQQQLINQQLNQSRPQRDATATRNYAQEQKVAANTKKVAPRNDTTLAPKGSVRSYVQKAADYMSHATDPKVDEQGNFTYANTPLDLLIQYVGAPILQSGINFANTIMGDRPVRNDADVEGLGWDALNLLPFADVAVSGGKSLYKSSRATNNLITDGLGTKSVINNAAKDSQIKDIQLAKDVPFVNTREPKFYEYGTKEFDQNLLDSHFGSENAGFNMENTGLDYNNFNNYLEAKEVNPILQEEMLQRGLLNESIKKQLGFPISEAADFNLTDPFSPYKNIFNSYDPFSKYGLSNVDDSFLKILEKTTFNPAKNKQLWQESLNKTHLMNKMGGQLLPKAQDGTITDPYIGMRKFYDDAYDALGKYENKQGEVSPFNVSRAWAKAAVKNPYLLFRDRHNLAEQGFSEDQIMSNAQNPYHKDSPVIRMSDTETRYQHPTDYVVPNEKDVERYNRYIANQTQQKSSKGNGFDLSDEWRDVKRGVRNASRDVRHFIGKEVPRALRNCVNGNCYEFHQEGGSLSKAQTGLANFGYENRMPRESTSTMYTPPTGYSHPKVHPISTWFENMIIGAIPYLGDAVDLGRGTLALKEGDNAHAFVNYLGAALPFVAGTTLQNGYDALGDYIHDHYINKPRESDPKKAKGGSTSKKLNAQQQYFQLLINQKNKK